MPSPEEPVAPSAAVDDERLGVVLDDSDKEPEADMLAVEETPAELDGEAPTDSEPKGCRWPPSTRRLTWWPQQTDWLSC